VDVRPRCQGSKVQREAAWAAIKAANDAGSAAARNAARAAMSAASAVYLHPLADANQVKHILGAAAHAARAAELIAGGDRPSVPSASSKRDAARHPHSSMCSRVTPAAPSGGGRVGELLRDLDAALRRRPVEA
jgi:hypothetical protein